MTELNALSQEELHAQVQHRLIEELGATERRLRRLLEILPEVAVQCDENGRITYLNEAWHTLLGYEVEESIGKSQYKPLDPLNQSFYPLYGGM